MEKRKFFFDHIYKAAGSSVDKFFIDRFGQEAVTFTLHEPAVNALATYREMRVITGHFEFSPREAIDADRYLLTVLRHPVDRLISHYYFVRNEVGVNLDPQVQLAKRLSLEEYVRHPEPAVRDLIDNNLTRHFMRLAWDGTGRPSPEQMLALAKEGLERYDLVGVFHEFEDFLHVLAADCGLGPVKAIPRENVTRKRAALHEISADARLALEEQNRLDIELYAHATSLFAKKRRAVLSRCAGGESRSATPASTVMAPPREYGTRQVELLGAQVVGDANEEELLRTSEITRLKLRLRVNEPVGRIAVGFRIQDRQGRIVFGTNTRTLGWEFDGAETGNHEIEFVFRCDLGPGIYSVAAFARSIYGEADLVYHWRESIAYLNVVQNMGFFHEGYVQLHAGVHSRGARLLTNLDGLEGRQSIALHTPPLAEFAASVRLVGACKEARAGEQLNLLIEVSNDSSVAWPTEGRRPVVMGYRWLLSDAPVRDAGQRTPLPHRLDPGETVRLWLALRAPDEPGLYELLISPVQDHVAWFCDYSGSYPRLTVRVHELS